MLPPTLDELLPLDHPARFVAEFVDALDRDAWAELGVDIEGDCDGSASLPSTCAVERVAVRLHDRGALVPEAGGGLPGPDTVSQRWLTGWQHPDHNTLWRFYRGHRQAMRKLFERTVRTAVTMKLVDLAVQAVDGTKVVANASLNRSYDAEGLRGLLERLESAIADLEAQNEAGEDTAVAHLPEELADKEVLREQVRQAMDDLTSQKRHKRINLTDPDARLMKGRQGIVAGYNAQAMVSPTETDGGATGMLVTAVDVVDAANDNALLVPMSRAGRRDDRDKSTYDVGRRRIFRRKSPGRVHPSRSAGGGVRVTATVPQRPISQGPIHLQRAERQLYVSAGTDAQVRSYTACERSPVATVPGFRRRLSGMPSLQSLYQGQGDWAKLSHRAARRSAASPSRLDVHFSSQRSLRGEKATGRACLRNHQGATGGT